VPSIRVFFVAIAWRRTTICFAPIASVSSRPAPVSALEAFRDARDVPREVFFLDRFEVFFDVDDAARFVFRRLGLPSAMV